jgi:hypothetical protein
MAISGSKDLIVFPNDNSGRFSIREVQYNSNGTFTVPTGITAVEVVAVGGGGGGGGGADVIAGGGGGGGQVVQRQVPVTPGQTYNVSIGAGGHGGQGASTNFNDYINTMPGGVGGTTTFGGSTPVNLLMNPSFNKGTSLWEANNIQQVQKTATGTTGLFTIDIRPDNIGIQVGMLVSGTGVGANAIVTQIATNTITLSAANTGAGVSGTVTFLLQSCTVTSTSIVYNDNIAVGASLGTNQSNNLIQAQYAQLEDVALTGSSFFVIDNLGSITAQVSSNPYPKLPEMVSPAAIGTSAGANALICTNSTTGARLVGLSTSAAGALSGGTTGFAYDPNATYTVSMYVYHTSPTPQNLVVQLRIGDGSNFPTNNQGTSNGTGTVYSSGSPAAGGYNVTQVTITAPLSGYGGTIAKTISGLQGNNFISVDNADGLFVGQAVSGTGIGAAATVVNIAGTTITLSANNAGAVSGTGTFAHTGIVSGAWRRVSATFTGLPSYAAGATAKWAYIGLLVPANVTMLFDNVQVELGTSATAYRPPTYNNGVALKLISTVATGANMEVSHDFVKATPGQLLTGSFYAWAWKEYRNANAYLEFYDADANFISRTAGTASLLGTTGTKMQGTSNLQATAGRRYTVSATTPANAFYVRLGATFAFAANNNTGAAEPEFYLAYAQLEAAAGVTFYKDGNTAGFTWAGEAHYSATITAPLLRAQGGGGGGTYNTNLRFWQFGLPGANAGGHGITNSSTTPTYGGGGAGAGGPGGNAISYAPQITGGVTTAGYGTSGSTMLQNVQQQGNQGGYAMLASNAATPSYGGDGGPGVIVNGTGTLAVSQLGGGGGGGGWNAFAQGSNNNPGRGQAGGGKGGHTYVAYLTGQAGGLITDYYARGLDAAPNTGSGGGGAGSNGGISPLTLLAHSASTFIQFEAATAPNTDMGRWAPVYNATTALLAGSTKYGTNALRTTIQDAGNAKVVTSWTDFPILPRTQLFFSGFSFRLNTGSNPGTPNLGTKVARPTIQWYDINKVLIREDRPSINASLVAATYTDTVAGTISTWQPPLAPANCAYFQVAVEMLNMSAGDVCDIDFNTVQYYPYVPTGGNGADGTVIIRYTEKFTA